MTVEGYKNWDTWHWNLTCQNEEVIYRWIQEAFNQGPPTLDMLKECEELFTVSKMYNANIELENVDWQEILGEWLADYAEWEQYHETD